MFISLKMIAWTLVALLSVIVGFIGMEHNAKVQRDLYHENSKQELQQMLGSGPKRLG